MGRNTAIYREKKYVCGEYLDVYIYPVYRRPGTRSRKARPTSETQKRLNQRHAEEKLARLLHANFTEEDLSLTLTYRENPEDEETVKREVRNFLRRLGYRREKLGLDKLKYICVTERSSRGRYHHHLVISGGMDRDVIEGLWTLGYANSKRLQFGENGITALARYIVKDPIFHKRWNASKNLIDPPAQINDSRIRSRKKAEELAQLTQDSWEEMYPEYALAEANQFHSDENGCVYLFARLYRRDGSFLKPMKRRRYHERQ